MSFNTLTPVAVSSEARPWAGTVWRMVEAQHTASTMKIVDSSEEQEPTTHPLISRVKVDSIHLSPEDLVPDSIVARWMSNEYRTNAQGTDLPQL